jgi:hypothetical protein
MVSPYEIPHLTLKELCMSSSISTSFPQAPLVVPEPLAKAKPNQMNAEQVTADAASAKVQATVDQNFAAKTVVPSDPTGGIVNLRA